MGGHGDPARARPAAVSHLRARRRGPRGTRSPKPRPARRAGETSRPPPPTRAARSPGGAGPGPSPGKGAGPPRPGVRGASPGQAPLCPGTLGAPFLPGPALQGCGRAPHRDIAVECERRRRGVRAARRRRWRHQELAMQLVQLPTDDAESLVVLVEDGRQELQLGLEP